MVEEPRYILWVLKMIIGILTLILSFGYTFAPVINSHLHPRTPKLQKTGHINPMNAAVATCIITLSAITSIDSIIRNAFTIVLATPPPKRFIETIKSMVIHRRPLNNLICDRGVNRDDGTDVTITKITSGISIAIQ
ncbi:8464_t:CDS:2 [Ambispora gerdemannii]|uniref:8464_t:CDS:1 n=1 Tax=Ambispora gerdemannii TaxID=144530 RepID=A0A9N9FW13_9GLOM|nr:8464_t:CDS:2 [Ambispora gerdemannii]